MRIPLLILAVTAIMCFAEAKCGLVLPNRHPGAWDHAVALDVAGIAAALVVAILASSFVYGLNCRQRTW